MHNKTQWQTVLAIAAVALFLSALKHSNEILWVVIAFLVLCTLSEKFASGFTKFWMAATGVVGSAVGFFVLCIVFYFVVLPVGVLKRVVSGDDGRFQKQKQDSYFTKIDGDFNKAFFERPW